MDIKFSDTKKIKSDLILDLPTDKNQPTHTELKVINSLFGTNINDGNNSSKNIYIEFLKYVILIFIFMITCNIPNEKIPKLPFIDQYEFTPLLIKGIVLAVLFYIVETKILSTL